MKTSKVEEKGKRGKGLIPMFEIYMLFTHTDLCMYLILQL